MRLNIFMDVACISGRRFEIKKEKKTFLQIPSDNTLHSLNRENIKFLHHKFKTENF